MVQMNDNIVGLDAAILMHPTTWKASGHVDAFNDPLIDNKDSKRRYRADVLIEDYAEKLNQKAIKEIEKARARFGDAFNEQEFITTNPRVVEYLAKEREILERMARSLGNEDLEDVKAFYSKYYQPSNAILVLAGNIEKEQASTLAKTYFGELTGSVVEKRIFEEPEQTMAKEKTVYEDVPLNAVYIAFKICDRLHPDYYASDVTSDILSNGTSSRLHQKLVKEEKAFVEIDAYITSSDDIGMFVVEGKITDGIELQKATDLIWAELKKMQEEKVNESELQKCKNKMLTYMNFSEASLLNRAISLAYYELLGNANLINEEEKQYDAVSAEHIQQFAQKTFIKERSNTLFYLKKESK